MLKRFVVLVFFVKVFIPGTGFASNASALTDKTVEKKEELEGFWNSLSSSLAYSVQSDFASELKPRLYSHLLSAGLNYRLNNGYSLNLNTSFRYKSLDNKIFLKKGNYGFNDLGVSLSKKLRLGNFLSAINSSTLTLGSSFPISEKARLEGYKAIPALSFSINSSFFDGKYALGNNFSYNYIINTYEYSPASGVANNRNSFSYAMSHSIKLIGKLVFKLGFGFRYSQDTKGESNYSYNNNQSLSYTLSKLRLGVSYYNGDFTSDDDVEFWYIDRYRKNLKLFLGYSF